MLAGVYLATVPMCVQHCTHTASTPTIMTEPSPWRLSCHNTIHSNSQYRTSAQGDSQRAEKLSKAQETCERRNPGRGGKIEGVRASVALLKPQPLKKAKPTSCNLEETCGTFQSKYLYSQPQVSYRPWINQFRVKELWRTEGEKKRQELGRKSLHVSAN